MQGLPNLMKAIDWADRDVPGRHGVLDVVRHQRGGVRVGGSAENAVRPVRPDLQAGTGQARHVLRLLRRRRLPGVSRAHKQTATAHRPVGRATRTSLPTSRRSAAPRCSPAGPGTPRRTSRSTTTAAATRSTGRGPRAAARRRCGTRPGDRSGPAVACRRVYPRPGVPGLGRGRRRQPPWRARPGLERCGQRRRAGVPHLLPEDRGPPAWGVFGGTSASSPQVAALTAIANQWRAAAGKAGIGNLNAVDLLAGVRQDATTFSDIIPHTYGTARRAACCRTTGCGSSRPTDRSPGRRCPATRRPTGYDLTTGWGSPKAAGYIAGLTAAP